MPQSGTSSITYLSVGLGIYYTDYYFNMTYIQCILHRVIYV